MNLEQRRGRNRVPALVLFLLLLASGVGGFMYWLSSVSQEPARNVATGEQSQPSPSTLPDAAGAVAPDTTDGDDDGAARELPLELERELDTLTENLLESIEKAGAAPSPTPAERTSTILRVVDGNTKADLDGLTLLERRYDDSFPGAGGARKVVVENASSPFELPEATGSKEYWLGRNGHAWKEIEVAHDVGGTFVHELMAAGSLHVVLQNVPESRPLNLISMPVPAEIESVHSSLQIEFIDQDELLITDVYPGDYNLVVSVGERWRDPMTLASATVTIAASVTTPLNLLLADLPVMPEPVAVAGTLLIPGEWAISTPPRLTLLSIALPAGAEGDLYKRVELSAGESSGLFSWDAGLLYPGRYRATLPGQMLDQAFEVPTEGDRNIRLEVAGKAEVHLRLTSPEGEEVTDAEVSWHIEFAEGANGGLLESAKFDPAVRAYTISCPVGAMVISATSKESSLEDEQVVLVSGHNLLERTLNYGNTFRVEFFDGETQVPIPAMSWLGLEFLDGVPHMKTSKRYIGGAALVTVDRAGLVAISFPALDGYEPIPSQTVEVLANQIVEVRVALNRLK